MIFKIVILLFIVGVLFGWDKIINLMKAFFQAKKEFRKALEEGREEDSSKSQISRKGVKFRDGL